MIARTVSVYHTRATRFQSTDDSSTAPSPDDSLWFEALSPLEWQCRGGWLRVGVTILLQCPDCPVLAWLLVLLEVVI